MCPKSIFVQRIYVNRQTYGVGNADAYSRKFSNQQWTIVGTLQREFKPLEWDKLRGDCASVGVEGFVQPGGTVFALLQALTTEYQTFRPIKLVQILTRR